MKRAAKATKPMTTSKLLLGLTLSSLLSIQTFAQSKFDLLGQWYNEEKTSKLDIYTEGDKFYGKIIWLETTTNEDGSSPRVDEFNPEDELKTRPLMELVILKDLQWDADDRKWEEGIIYDPESGNTYDCYC